MVNVMTHHYFTHLIIKNKAVNVSPKRVIRNPSKFYFFIHYNWIYLSCYTGNKKIIVQEHFQEDKAEKMTKRRSQQQGTVAI